MGLLKKIAMTKVLFVTAVFTSFHLIEDMIWLSLGRFTSIPYWIMVIVIILLGFSGGVILRHPIIRRFLGK